MRILVTGATSLLGLYLLPRLMGAGHEVIAVSRRAPPGVRGGVRWLQGDMMALSAEALRGVEAVVHLAPLWALPGMLEGFAALGVTRLVAFGSTSVFTKTRSRGDKDRMLARSLAESESAVAVECSRLGIAWTLLRPTLIYDGVHDRNVASIARFIRRFGVFPLAGRAGGLRQPVHADDLAAACVSALTVPAARNRAYNLSGGEVLCYRAMVEAIFRGLGRAPRFLPIPLVLLRLGISLVSLGRLSPDMADRMNQDMCFDSGEAGRDLGFHPRPFCFFPQARKSL